MTDPNAPETSTLRLDYDMSAAHTYFTNDTVLAFGMSPVTPDPISIHGADGEALVTIHPDGRLEYGATYTPDEAARVFWDALQTLARLHQYGPALNANINRHLANGQDAERKVARLDQMAAAWLTQLPDTIRTATAAEAVHQITRGDAR